ncbi:MAG: sulfatase-like hydrolase/transferase [Pseudomonadota bacterium]|nr:sulfatase-like hydrolase/transferase [Pseudomonadota bacterium]
MFLHLLFACSGGDAKITAPPVLEGPRPDVVVVTLDTTRADRLGAYGYKLAQTDTIDRLADNGIRFDNAYSPLPLTIPAHATLFTGLLPFHHHIRGNGDNVLAPEFTTLAEILRKEGWSTAASVAAFVTTRQWGFAQGFGAYFDSMPEADDNDRNYWHNERPGALVVDDALNWLAGQPAEQPVFLWVHLYDAHYPFVPKGTYAESTPDRPYDGELAYVDDQIGRLVEAFEGRNVLWALIGDHGESLGEHDELSHGLFTYNATQHVPWILSGAGVPAGVVKEPVSAADLTPTLLHLLSLPVPEGLDGKPQPGGGGTPYAESYTLSDRFRLAPHRAVVEGTLKLIATPKPELYDLAADPGELTNLAASRPDDVARLTATLAAMNATPPSANGASMDADTLSQLAALGYMTTGGGDTVDPLTLPDSKDFQPIITAAKSLERGPGDLTPEQLLAKIDGLLALKPDAFELRMRRLTLLARLERRDEAKLFAEETTTLFPGRARVWLMLATMAMQERDSEQALAYARRAVEAEPGEGAAREAVVEALFTLKRPEEGLAEAVAAMTADPKNYGVAALLGRYYLGMKDLPNAEKYLRLAVTGPNPRRAARQQLALLALAAGARADAYNLLDDEVKDYPGNQVARKMLSRMYAEDQRWLDQRDHVGFLARANPEDPLALRAFSQCLFNLGDYLGARATIDVALDLAPEDPDVLMLHANLLAKEGKREEGLQVLAAANAANAKRIEAQKAEAAKSGAKPSAPKSAGSPTAAGTTGAGKAPAKVAPTPPAGAPAGGAR